MFRRLVDSVQDYAIFLLTPSGVIATWNVGAQRIKGYTGSEAIGKHFSMFYTTEALDVGWPDEELRRAARDGKLEDEGWRLRKDGSRFWANVIITALRSDNGHLLGYAKVTRDLTQRLHVERLEAEGQRISEFIAILSHELRNPLTPIQMATALLAQMSLPPRGDWCVEVIDRQVAHLRRLVDDLLDVSRISTGKLQIEKTELDFVKLVQDAVESVRLAVETDARRLTIEAPESRLLLSGDAIRLTQVVTNLLNNAAKFTPGAGHVHVAVEGGADNVRLKVSDTGVGMSESLQSRAFDPFVQGAPPPGHPNSGLGIGLALVKSIVTMHGGSVNACSAGTGKGTTVTVTLPLKD